MMSVDSSLSICPLSAVGDIESHSSPSEARECAGKKRKACNTTCPWEVHDAFTVPRRSLSDSPGGDDHKLTPQQPPRAIHNPVSPAQPLKSTSEYSSTLLQQHEETSDAGDQNSLDHSFIPPAPMPSAHLSCFGGPPVEEIHIPAGPFMDHHSDADSWMHCPVTDEQNESWKSLYFVAQRDLFVSQERTNHLTDENRRLKRQLFELQRRLYESQRKRQKTTNDVWKVPESRVSSSKTMSRHMDDRQRRTVARAISCEEASACRDDSKLAKKGVTFC